MLNAAFVLTMILCQDAPYEYGKPPKCDVKKIEKGQYCENCMKVLEKEDLNEKKECKTCQKPPKAVELCVKEFFQCPDCMSTEFKPGTCAQPECKKAKLEKKLSKALVVWRCTGTCMTPSEKPGKCGSDGCNKRGRAYEKSCDKSGQPPHAPPPKR